MNERQNVSQVSDQKHVGRAGAQEEACSYLLLFDSQAYTPPVSLSRQYSFDGERASEKGKGDEEVGQLFLHSVTAADTAYLDLEKGFHFDMKTCHALREAEFDEMNSNYVYGEYLRREGRNDEAASFDTKGQKFELMWQSSFTHRLF